MHLEWGRVKTFQHNSLNYSTYIEETYVRNCSVLGTESSMTVTIMVMMTKMLILIGDAQDSRKVLQPEFGCTGFFFYTRNGIRMLVNLNW